MAGLRHFGRLTRVAGWVAVLLAVSHLFIFPLIQLSSERPSSKTAVEWFMQTFYTVPAVTQILAVFIPLGLVIWAGGYTIQIAEERELRQEERVIGLLRAYGRISLGDLSTRLGLTIAEMERFLASIRGTRDIVFSISDATVIMPGYERSRPVKEIEKITREVVTVACKYCGALIPMGITACPECGARLKKLA